MNNSICLIHYQPIEYYPPAYNLINELSKSKFINVLTNHNNRNIPNFGFNANVRIKRFAVPEEGRTKFKRLYHILKFNFLATVELFYLKPNIIVYIENQSILPVFIFNYLSKRRKFIFCHYHEYTSIEKLKTETFVSRVLSKLEPSVISKAVWISHTNDDRVKLYSERFPQINKSVLHSFPNFPPRHWQAKRNNKIDLPLNIVYIGSISLKNMYSKEFLTWVSMNVNKVNMDIYSINYTTDIIQFIESLNAPNIKFHPGVRYDLLPRIMDYYDVGTILYDSSQTNYVYNAPNKLFEYLACGLDVWLSNDLISSQPYLCKNSFPKVISLDFNNLDKLNVESLIDRENMVFKEADYFSDVSTEELINKIEKILSSKE